VVSTDAQSAATADTRSMNGSSTSPRPTTTSSRGSDELDASLLMIPMVGFLPPSDPRVASTVDAIQRELTVDGFVERYPTHDGIAVDGLTGREGAFLLCTFWLADALALIGRMHEAADLFERLTGLANDVGLLAEEYDPVSGRLLGNFPQAFSHIGLVNTALNLGTGTRPAEQRGERDASDGCYRRLPPECSAHRGATDRAGDHRGTTST
jgi:GH15 family glucan-1,4-alpha-glucosidase